MAHDVRRKSATRLSGCCIGCMGELKRRVKTSTKGSLSTIYGKMPRLSSLLIPRTLSCTSFTN